MTIRPTRPAPPDAKPRPARKTPPPGEPGDRDGGTVSLPPRAPLPLLTQRSAVMLALALTLGMLAALLADHGPHLAGTADLAGAIAAAVLPLLNRIIE